MRQAGRYMAEYQAVREKVSFTELCKIPDLAAEVTVTAAKRLGVDAAIIFSDILLIVEPMGMELTYHDKKGPQISPAIKNIEAIQKLKPVEVETSLNFVSEAIKKVCNSMPNIPLIGFAGAPFTLASYIIEGGSSRTHENTKKLMKSDPKGWNLLLEKLTTIIIDHLNLQIESGCHLVQIFDSLIGALSAGEYREFVLPHTQRLIKGIKKGIPVIHFGTFSKELLDLQKTAGGDVLSVHHSVDIKSAWDRFGPDVGVQGNLDPNLLLKKPDVFLKETEKILKAVGSRPGFIFNLGHGVLPKTPVDHVLKLVDFVHNWKMC